MPVRTINQKFENDVYFAAGLTAAHIAHIADERKLDREELLCEAVPAIERRFLKLEATPSESSFGYSHDESDAMYDAVRLIEVIESIAVSKKYDSNKFLVEVITVLKEVALTAEDEEEELFKYSA